MFILIVSPLKSTGASMIFVKRQTESLIKIGVCVKQFFLVSRTSPVLVCYEILRLRREIVSFKPKIIHAQYGTMTSFICVLCSLFTKTRLVITFRGSDLNPSLNVSRIRSIFGGILSQISALFAWQVICVSEQLKSRLWFKRRKAVVIPSGINLLLFCEIPQTQARKRLGISSRNKIVLFNAANFRKVKRFDIAKEVMKIVMGKVRNVELLVLKGAVDPEDVKLYINASDCLLVTSDWEGSPNIVKEAMACNLPVISVDVGDVRERLLEVVPSAVVATQDPLEIADRVVEVLKLGKRSNGREKLKEISEEKIAYKIKMLYESGED